MASSQRTSLSDKLKSLGVGKGASHLPQPKPDSLSIDSVVAGAFHRHVTFQTCIDAEGNASWGRLFVIAIPKEEVTTFDRLDN